MYNILTLESWTGHNDKTLTDERDSKTPQNNPESCTWLFGPSLSPVQWSAAGCVSGHHQISQYWTIFAFHNAQQTLYLQCEVPDL